MTNNATPFYGTTGPRNARIAIVGEAWGAKEKEKQLALVGSSGQDLDAILSEIGFNRDEIFCTNIVAEQPTGNKMERFFYPTHIARKDKIPEYKGLYPRTIVYEGLDRLKKELSVVKPDVIVSLGNYALWALSDEIVSIGDDEGFKVPRGIGDWRGSQLYSTITGEPTPLLPVYHPAAALRQYPLRYMIRHDLRMRLPLALNDRWTQPSYNFLVRPSEPDIAKCLYGLLDLLDLGPTDVALDLETSGMNIACIGFSWEWDTAVCIPLMCDERIEGYFQSREQEYEALWLIRKILLHPNLRLIGQNLAYDLQYIALQFLCKPRVYLDTMIAHHVLWAGGGNPEKRTGPVGIQQKGLDNLSSLYCRYHRYWKHEGKKWTGEVDEDTWWQYNCKDAVATFEIAQVLKRLIATEGLEDQLEFQMRNLNDVALPMMLRGMAVDDKRRTEVAMELDFAIQEHEQYLDGLIPESIFPRDPKKRSWTRSPHQQREIFYDILGIKPIISRKTGRPTLDKNALPILAQREPLIRPIVGKLENLRRLGVFYSTFTQARLDPDGRMRSSFNIAGTETYRWSSSENAFGRGANLQNIPKGTEDDEDEADKELQLPNVRKFFIPDPGYTIAEFDLSGADAQIVAWEANEPALMEQLRAGVKLHAQAALDFHGTSSEPYYSMCKRRIHATNYGASPRTLAIANRTQISVEQEFQDYWFGKYPGIHAWHTRVEQALFTKRRVHNSFGFRITYFDRVEGLLPQALAWIPQSSVAIFCIKGALALVDNLPWVELLAQVHDSLVVQFPTERYNDWKQIKEVLHSVYAPYPTRLYIPWTAKASTKSWGDATPILGW